MNRLLITIDGPAGAGKTTVSKHLAERLSYTYVDTGALYRCVALAVIESDIDPEDASAVSRLCDKVMIRFDRRVDGIHIILNDKDVSEKIRTPEVAMMASKVSAKSVVREFLFELQRDLGKSKGTVFEGRDMGTVVFPDADVKFFLVASLEKRAARRYDELKTNSLQSLDDVTRDMQIRDQNDSSRACAPLKPATDATPIDSTSLSVAEVIELMMAHITPKL